jgi:hypothetical protein
VPVQATVVASAVVAACSTSLDGPQLPSVGVTCVKGHVRIGAPGVGGEKSG